MGTRSSNVARNRWAVDLLDIEAGHTVLEIGFGPGVAVEEAVGAVGPGRVCGFDHSELMVEWATGRNAAAVATGIADLRLGSVDDPPDFGARFDRIYTVNTVLFWPDPPRQLGALADRLAPGGTVTLVSQPRSPGADEETTRQAGDDLRRLLEGQGLVDLRRDWLDLRPTPVVAVTGTARP